jgi:hypothetical protein
LATAKEQSAAGPIECHRSNSIEALWYPKADRVNRPMADAFGALGETDFDRRTHFIRGRFENLYLRSARLPGLPAVLEFGLDRAGQLLDIAASNLRVGFWLNAMAPGQSTSRHCHEENDELLSGVYYVTAPRDSGAILFHDGPFETRVVPRAGLMLLFPPELPHSVGTNMSQELRLSIAFNIGLKQQS